MILARDEVTIAGEVFLRLHVLRNGDAR